MGSNSTTLVKFSEENLLESLKPMVYTLGQNERTGQYYLEYTKDKFDIDTPYGNVNKRVEKILNTYSLRNGNTGVLLTGDKGSGKTMTENVDDLGEVLR